MQHAIENTQSQIIWCARGGYGSADLLPFLHQMPKPPQPKIFIGFSDLVSVTSFLQEQWGWTILCAPMLGQMALQSVSHQASQAIVDLLFGKTDALLYDLDLLHHVHFSTIHGEIVGGCISVLAGHFGTENQINWQDKILFFRR